MSTYPKFVESVVSILTFSRIDARLILGRVEYLMLGVLRYD